MSPPQEPSTPLAALHELMVELFSTDELRRWLRHGPDGDVVPELPGDQASQAEQVGGTLAALERRGRITADFFDRLEAERPGRNDEIAAIALVWARQESPGSSQVERRAPPSPPASAGASLASPVLEAAVGVEGGGGEAIVGVRGGRDVEIKIPEGSVRDVEAGRDVKIGVGSTMPLLVVIVSAVVIALVVLLLGGGAR